MQFDKLNLNFPSPFPPFLFNHINLIILLFDIDTYYSGDRIIKDLEILIAEHTEHRQSVWYEENGREYRLFLEDVLYMEASNKKIKAFDKNGKKIVLKNTLSEWGELCKEKYFVRCHRSYLVNMRYVKVYSRTEFEMTNEDIVPIGRKYEKQTREIWNLHKMEEEV